MNKKISEDIMKMKTQVEDILQKVEQKNEENIIDGSHDIPQKKLDKSTALKIAVLILLGMDYE